MTTGPYGFVLKQLFFSGNQSTHSYRYGIPGWIFPADWRKHYHFIG
jgi:hypothetical protein